VAINWDSLRSELQGHLVLPADPTYDLLRRPFNARIDRRPAAVARCVSEADVAACVRFAHRHDIAVSCRSGGHGAEGYCSIDDALMIDQSAMQEIRVDTEQGVVHVGAGAQWGQVDIATYPRLLAAPGGGCQTVGVGGLAQGGGFGPLSRSRGLTIDNLVSARIVTSRDLKAIEADATRHPDLFWALRGGGGGNFGAVTQFTFRLGPIEPALLGGMLVYAWKDARRVFQFYRDWMNAADNDERLTLLPIFGFGPGNSPVALISAFYNGDYDEGLAYVGGILSAASMPQPLNVPPGAPLSVALGPGTLQAYTGTESTTAWPGSGQLWRSGFLDNDFPDQAIDTFLEWFAKCPPPPERSARPLAAGSYKQNDLSFGFIESLGGAIGRVGKADTAFYWRDQRFSFTFIGVYDPSDAEWAARTHVWADDFRNAMAPYLMGGVYVNYRQAELPDYQHAYYGPNVDRLREVKRKYDPKHLFRFPQDVWQ
jgi:FAD/FMN-containing dehydrogenase